MKWEAGTCVVKWLSFVSFQKQQENGSLPFLLPFPPPQRRNSFARQEGGKTKVPRHDLGAFPAKEGPELGGKQFMGIWLYFQGSPKAEYGSHTQGWHLKLRREARSLSLLAGRIQMDSGGSESS